MVLNCRPVRSKCCSGHETAWVVLRQRGIRARSYGLAVFDGCEGDRRIHGSCEDKRFAATLEKAWLEFLVNRHAANLHQPDP